MPERHEAMDALVEAGRLAGQRGLLSGTAGNLSLRLDDDHFLITAHGARLDELSRQHLIQCAVAGDAAATPDASSEIQVHRRVYQRRPEVNAVIHLSPPHATLVCCTDIDLPLDVIPESILHLDQVSRVPYIQPGTDELGRAVAEALRDGTTVLMANHGVVTVGASVEEAFRRMETLEFLCRLVVSARAAGLTVQGIGGRAAAELRRGTYRS